MEDLIPVDDENLTDLLAWGLRHQAGMPSLAICRRLARLQLEHLQRPGVLAYRRPAGNHRHFKPG